MNQRSLKSKIVLHQVQNNDTSVQSQPRVKPGSRNEDSPAGWRRGGIPMRQRDRCLLMKYVYFLIEKPANRPWKTNKCLKRPGFNTVLLLRSPNQTHQDKLPNITPHVLRHTFCTDMENASMNTKHLQYLMGDSNIETTMNVYPHVNKETARDSFYRIMGSKTNGF